MDKNTITAVVLIFLVLIGYTIVQAKFFPPPQPQQVEQTQIDENAAEENSAQTAQVSEEINSIVYTNSSEDSTGANENLVEKKYTITTDKIKVVFTNRGGDIVSYELLDHKDTKTGSGVEMADNISAKNRAFSLAFGGAENSIVNDLFDAKEFPEANGEKKIAFAKKFSDFTLVKQYTFKNGEYMFRMNVVIDGGENFSALNFPTANGMNASYTLRTSPQVGPAFDPKIDRYESRSFLALNEGKSKNIRLGTGQFKDYNKEFEIAGIGGKYFCELVIPLKNSILENAYYSTEIEIENSSNAQARLVRKPITEKQTNDIYYVYVGPRAEKDLRVYSNAENNGWNLSGYRLTDAMDSGGFLGWLETILKWILELVYKIVPNWGVSIIILTLILRVALFPLSIKASVGTTKMQELQPKMQAIQAKYKDNPQKMQAETAKLYQEVGYNPMSGCLPMILQMMCLFAMYNLFNNYFEFRGASFIKGWIDDLSAGDSIYVLNFNLPLLRSNHIRILPVIYLVSQLLYGKITQVGGTATAAQNSTQMKFMTYGLPILFFFILYNTPSGLILFWTMSNILQMIQQVIINKSKAKEKNSAAQKNVVKMKKR